MEGREAMHATVSGMHAVLGETWRCRPLRCCPGAGCINYSLVSAPKSNFVQGIDVAVILEQGLDTADVSANLKTGRYVRISLYNRPDGMYTAYTREGNEQKNIWCCLSFAGHVCTMHSERTV